MYLEVKKAQEYLREKHGESLKDGIYSVPYKGKYLKVVSENMSLSCFQLFDDKELLTPSKD